MPPANKRSKLAKAQRAAGGRFFDNGLADSLLELAIDPTYVPSDSSAASDDNDNDSGGEPEGGWAFSLFDEEESGLTAPREEEQVTPTGAKKRVMTEAVDSSDIESEPEAETEDYIAVCAMGAASTAKSFWNEVLKVSSKFRQKT